MSEPLAPEENNVVSVGVTGEDAPQVIEENPPAATDVLIKYIALVSGERLTEVPEDLYIPPDALEIFLEAFEGPLDLLLYLIKRQNLDILNIPIANITAQYMEYVDLMKQMRLELVGDYLVMAATLAEIKSRLLLPRHEEEEDEDVDPRAELVRRLQEYERFKQAAEDLQRLPQKGIDFFQAQTKPPEKDARRPLPTVEFKDLLYALKDVMSRVDMQKSHKVVREALSTRERMTQVLSSLDNESFTEFVELFTLDEGRMGVVVTFLAILQLLKESLIEMVQQAPLSPIYVKAV